MSITRLPVELESRILRLVPELRFASAHYYALYNELFRERLFADYGEIIQLVILQTYQVLRKYVKSYDSIFGATRKLIQKQLAAVNLECTEFVSDSWRLVYYLVRYRKRFLKRDCFVVQPSDRYVFGEDRSVTVAMAYTLRYEEAFVLARGRYYLGVCVSLGDPCLGLGTIKFSIEVLNASGVVRHYSFYAASNITEMMPKNHICFLNLGQFDCDAGDGSVPRVRFLMEETGSNAKCGIQFHYIDLRGDQEKLQKSYTFAVIDGTKEAVNRYEMAASVAVDEALNRSFSADFEIAEPAIPALPEPSGNESAEFCVTKNGAVKRTVKFNTMAGQREFFEKTNENYDKLPFGDAYILKWRTNWNT